jgi:hypothetical protein
MALSNVGMPIDTTTEFSLALVYVKGSNLLQADSAVEFPQCEPVARLGANVVSGRKGVAGVETDSHPIAPLDLFEKLRQFLEAMADATAHPGSVLQ